jgi:hypothetical protein
MVLGVCFAGKRMNNFAEAERNGRELDRKIGEEVLALAQAAPQEVIKSPRFMQSLSIKFNSGFAHADTGPAPAQSQKAAAPVNGPE